MGDQALVQLTGQHGDAVHPGVVPKPVAGHADLAAAGLEQHIAVEVGPLLNREIKPGGQSRGPGQRDTHEPLQMRTPVLAQLQVLGCRSHWDWIRFRLSRGLMSRELVLAIGIPLLALLLAVLALEQWRDQLPAWMQRLVERPAWLWNTGIGLIIGLSLLRWLLQR